MPHIITTKYIELKNLLSSSPLSPFAADMLSEINDLCQSEITTMHQLPVTSQSTAAGKNYIVFTPHDNPTKYSRPVNIDLYNEGSAIDVNGQSKISIFFENVRNRRINQQSADDITAALYTIVINYCVCTDLVPNVTKNHGDYFEKLVGYLYSMHLGTSPTTQMNAVELDGSSISIPTDYIFDLGVGKPKLHVPAKTSTRERCVEVWAQQRILDGAFGVGRFFCLLTCIGETNFFKNTMSVAITCVPNQWMNYQLFIAQITRAYYLDVPSKYLELNNRFPKIHVKKFGEFFHESDNLIN